MAVPAAGYSPSTFLDDLTKLDKAGVTPLCLGAKDPFATTALFENTLLTVVGANGWRQITADRFDWNSASVDEALRRFGRILDYAVPQAAALSWDAATKKLSKGGCAFETLNDSAFGELVDAGAVDGKTFGEVPYPGTDGTYVAVVDTFNRQGEVGCSGRLWCVERTCMDVTEHELTDPWEGILVTPACGGDVGVLVLGGSSGRIEHERTRVLARQGMTALSIRWFGGPGQPPGICGIPLETFTEAIGLLQAHGARRIGILGLSKGAEAALLTSVHEPRVDVVVALSPTSRVWCNVGPGRDGLQRPYRSSWTWQGQPLPFVPMDDAWTPAEPGNGPVAVRGWYELSELTFAHLLPAAEIAVEKARADLLLVAGGDDAMWPSLRFAEQLAARRRSAGASVHVISREDAGHRPRFPGESPAQASQRFLYGGTPHADALLGAAAWPHILDALGGQELS